MAIRMVADLVAKDDLPVCRPRSPSRIIVLVDRRRRHLAETMIDR